MAEVPPAPDRGGGGTVRCFVAAPVTDAVRDRIRAVQEALQRALGRGALRWADPLQAHVTLRFFGDLRPDEVADVAATLDAVAAGRDPLALRIAGVAAVPGPSRARVLWLGVAGDVAELAALRSDLDARTASIGAPPDPRPFDPHLTLARARGRRAARLDPQALTAAASPPETTTVPTAWTVDRLELVASELSPEGALHRRLHAARLGASA